MSDEIRFHCDENVPTAIADGLRRRGVDVSTTPESGLMGATDEEQLEFIRREGRMIVTQDTDFLRLHSQGEAHPGIAFWQLGARSLGNVISSLLMIYEEMTPEEVANRVSYL